jgi:hypothetical protein
MDINKFDRDFARADRNFNIMFRVVVWVLSLQFS